MSAPDAIESKGMCSHEGVKNFSAFSLEGLFICSYALLDNDKPLSVKLINILKSSVNQ